MSFTEKVDVLDLIINILQKHEQKLDELITRLEALVPDPKRDPERESIAEESAASADENTVDIEEQTAATNSLAENAAKLEELATGLQRDMAKFTL